MERNSKKIKIIDYRPHLVTYESCEDGELRQVRRQRFENKLALGFYDVLNPRALPRP